MADGGELIRRTISDEGRKGADRKGSERKETDKEKEEKEIRRKESRQKESGWVESDRVESFRLESGQVEPPWRRPVWRMIPSGQAGRACQRKRGPKPGGPWWRDEDCGSGSSMGIALVALVALGLVIVAMVGNLLICRAGARTAADASALAAATVLDEGSGSPCVQASVVASADRGNLTACTVEGEDVLVEVGVDTSVLIIPRVAQSSRAGPVDCA